MWMSGATNGSCSTDIFKEQHLTILTPFLHGLTNPKMCYLTFFDLPPGQHSHKLSLVTWGSLLKTKRLWSLIPALKQNIQNHMHSVYITFSPLPVFQAIIVKVLCIYYSYEELASAGSKITKVKGKDFKYKISHMSDTIKELVLSHSGWFSFFWMKLASGVWHFGKVRLV